MQHWKDAKDNYFSVRVPHQVGRIIDAIGLDATVKVILEFGGAPIYAGKHRVNGRGRLQALIGEESVKALSKIRGDNVDRVPLAPKFLARHLRGLGESVQEIARILRRSDVTIREYLKPDGGFDREKVLQRAQRLEQQAEDMRAAAGNDT